MSDRATTAQAPRVRANADEQKGGFVVEVTVETFDGTDPAPLLAAEITEVKEALRTAGHKLVSDAA